MSVVFNCLPLWIEGLAKSAGLPPWIDRVSDVQYIRRLRIALRPGLSLVARTWPDGQLKNACYGCQYVLGASRDENGAALRKER